MLATLLQSREQYLKTIILSKVPNFVLLAHPVVWFTMDLQTGHLEDKYQARIIVLLLFTMRIFCIFFQINFSIFFFFSIFWRKNIRRHLVKDALL